MSVRFSRLGVIALAGFTMATSISAAVVAMTPEPIVGLPCEGCEAVFQGLPTDLGPVGRIAPVGEPGEPMRIRGVVRDREKRPVAGIVVYAYQTDAKGLYPTELRFTGQAAYRHGRLRGWVRTDAQGRYEFITIRPAGYPNTDLPHHIHMHILEPMRCTYYIDDVMFTDDVRLTVSKRKSLTSGRAGDGIAQPARDATNTWIASRDIELGRGIPGYEGCGAARR